MRGVPKLSSEERNLQERTQTLIPPETSCLLTHSCRREDNSLARGRQTPAEVTIVSGAERCCLATTAADESFNVTVRYQPAVDVRRQAKLRIACIWKMLQMPHCEILYKRTPLNLTTLRNYQPFTATHLDPLAHQHLQEIFCRD